MKKFLFFLYFFVCSQVYAELKLFSTDSKMPFGENEFVSKMDEIFKEGKNLLFFVHGRGQHPEKGLNLILEMEKRYDLKVVMFHWDSWIDVVTRPVESAINSSGDLRLLFILLDNYRRTHSQLIGDKKISLLAHSMGNLVVKYFVKNYFVSQLSPQLFDSFILNAADTKAKFHKNWLEKIYFANQIFVVMNKHDRILLASKASDFVNYGILFSSRLGRKIEARGKYYSLVDGVYYIDLSNLVGKGHRHFLRKLEEREFFLHLFFQNILNGEIFHLEDYQGVLKSPERPNLYIFK